MGVHLASVSSVAMVNATILTTAETIVCTSPPLNVPLDSCIVFLLWMIEFTTGTGVTGETTRIRRGAALTSTLINFAGNTSIGPSIDSRRTGVWQDTPGVVAGVQYSITLQMAAATGNTTINECSLIAFVL